MWGLLDVVHVFVGVVGVGSKTAAKGDENRRPGIGSTSETVNCHGCLKVSRIVKDALVDELDVSRICCGQIDAAVCELGFSGNSIQDSSWVPSPMAQRVSIRSSALSASADEGIASLR